MDVPGWASLSYAAVTGSLVQELLLVAVQTGLERRFMGPGAKTNI